jgi:hypothetical protein
MQDAQAVFLNLTDTIVDQKSLVLVSVRADPFECRNLGNIYFYRSN